MQTRRRMRHAFLITAHRDRGQLTDLVDVLATDSSHVFVHLDRKASFPPAEVLAEVRRPDCVTLVSPQLRVQWGAPSLLHATLLLLRTASRSASFDYHHLLTGQCHPTRHPEEILRFFREHRGREFLESFPLPSTIWGPEGGLDRMTYYHFYGLLNAQKRVGGIRLNHRIIHLLVKLQRLAGLRRRLPGSFPDYYGGSAYWSLTGACVEYVLGELRRTPDLEKAFDYTCSAEEILFQTLIMNSPFKEQVSDTNLRYIDWSHRNGSLPANLDETDLEAILSSGALFARKFDPTHSRVLLTRLCEHAGIVRP